MHLPALLLASFAAYQSPAAATEEVTAPAVTTAATAAAAISEPVGKVGARVTAATESAVAATASSAIPIDELAEEGVTQKRRLTSWQSADDARTGAGVGIVIGLYNPSLSALNRIAEDFGFPGGFGSGVVYMNGIRGYGYVGPNFRIGGLIVSGSRSVVAFGEQFDRSLQAEAQHGGISLEGVYPAKRWEAYIGGMIGVGSYEFRYSQVAAAEPAQWDDIVDRFGATPSTDTFTKEFVAGYTALEPWVGAKYKFLPWFAIDGRVGYHWGRIGQDDWVFSDIPNFGIKGSPAVDASGISAALEITFGFFPY